MRRQCVPGPVFHRPDLKEKLGPGNEAKLQPAVPYVIVVSL